MNIAEFLDQYVGEDWEAPGNKRARDVFQVSLDITNEVAKIDERAAAPLLGNALTQLMLLLQEEDRE